MPIWFETDPEWVCSIVRMKTSPMSPQNHQIHTLAWNSNALNKNGVHHGHDRCYLHPPLISHTCNTTLYFPFHVEACSFSVFSNTTKSVTYKQSRWKWTSCLIGERIIPWFLLSRGIWHEFSIQSRNNTDCFKILRLHPHETQYIPYSSYATLRNTPFLSQCNHSSQLIGVCGDSFNSIAIESCHRTKSTASSTHRLGQFR